MVLNPFSFFSASSPKSHQNEEQICLLLLGQNDPASIDEIKKGEWLGSGGFGAAYKIGNTVYKIPYLTGVVDRAAKYWNLTYERIYDGKYKDFATARVIKVNNIDVLVTPYIRGDNYSLWYWNKLRHALADISLMMIDKNISGNVKIYGEDKDPLPVDFDGVCPVPKSYCRFMCCTIFSFAASSSPTTKNLWRREYPLQQCDVDTLCKKYFY